MGNNIAIFIEISALVSNVKLFNNILSYLPKILINQYWLELIVCIACMIFCLLIGSYLIDALIKNIRRKLKEGEKRGFRNNKKDH